MGIVAGLFLCSFASVSLAQGNNGNGNGNTGGISIDAQGVLRREVSRRTSPTVAERRREEFARAHLNETVTAFTERRLVSLRAIETALQKLSPHEPVPTDLKYLYGLQRIDEVLVDTERQDILLAGPAEGFAPDAEDRFCGLTTGRPPIRLDDLLVALRSANRDAGELGCSIDPEGGRLAQLQDWLRVNSTPAARTVAQRRYGQMANILGLQNVRVWGVPPDSHFAVALVEADFRMKLIALGKERPGVKGLRSQLSLLTPEGNTMQRWWFVPLYNPIEVDEDRLTFRLSGQRAQVLAQEEWTDASGGRSSAPMTRRSTQQFARLFTENFEKLADSSPPFAELQNLFDVAVLAALIKKENLSRQLEWPMSGLLDPSVRPAEKYPIPQHVESQFVTTNRGNFVLGLIGGIHLDANRVVHQTAPAGASSADLRESRVRAVSTRPPSATAVWWDDPQSTDKSASDRQPTTRRPSKEDQPSVSDEGADPNDPAESGTKPEPPESP